VLPVRNMQKGLALKQTIADESGNENVEVVFCRLDSLASVRTFADVFRKTHDRLDLLINNAGIWEMKRKNSEDGIEMNFAVNHLAPFLMTNLLLDMLKASAPARVINVSSMAHRFAWMRFDDLEGKKRWNSFHSYAQSKLANILFTNRLADELNGDGVSVNSLHPGMVKTHLFDNMPAFIRKPSSLIMISPEKGAETTIYLASAAEGQTESGAHYARKKKIKAASHANDKVAADKLWTLSKEYCGLD
jgi:NAD(P)-dependent dehydrogenase (short-subunit alcohol dehydrogenase family)